MKQYFTTDDLRRDLHVMNFFLGKDGIEINYFIGPLEKHLTAPPAYASLLLTDTGFIEAREVLPGEAEAVWVEESCASVSGQEVPLWKPWAQFIRDGAKLSQYWALQVVLRHEENEMFKRVSWEIGRPTNVNHQNN